MFCPNCGKQLDSNEQFCTKCGTAVNKHEEKRLCTQCGKELGNEEQFCPVCGTPFSNPKNYQSSQQVPKTENHPSTKPMSNSAIFNYFFAYKKCLPAFIIGLIGSILGMFGGICTTMCSCGSASNSAFLYIFGGAVIGLIGSCLCLNKAKLGSLIQLIGALMIIIRAYSRGSELFTTFSFVLLLTASIVGIICAYLLDLFKKK